MLWSPVQCYHVNTCRSGHLYCKGTTQEGGGAQRWAAHSIYGWGKMMFTRGVNVCSVQVLRCGDSEIEFHWTPLYIFIMMYPW